MVQLTTARRDHSRAFTQRAGLLLGLSVLMFIAGRAPFDGMLEIGSGRLHLPIDHPDVRELARGAQVTLGIMLLMLVWWVTEAVPLAITALLPGVLLPLLRVTGQADGGLYPFAARAAFEKYAHPVIFLFLGGFLLAAGMRKTGLDRRITLWVLSQPIVSHSAATVILAIMLVTGGLSMLISNTATTAMMIPVVVGILEVLGEHPGRSRVGIAAMLGVAWSASLGGIGTLIGSPPNLIAAGILEESGAGKIEFIDWMRIGIPVAVCGILVAWGLLLVLYKPHRRLGPSLRASLVEKRRALGRTSRDEKVVVAVVFLVMGLWMTHRHWNLLLPGSVFHVVQRFGVNEIGLLGGLLLFSVPIERRTWHSVLTWSDTKYVDWGTLLLFGGGLTLSAAMFKTGLTDWIAGGLIARLGGVSPLICLVCVILLVDYLTEIASNTAVATMILPLLIVAAPGLGLSPRTLCMAAAMAASMAFMFPVATPPNALVYSTGYLRLGQMVRSGFLMNLLGCGVLIVVLSLLTRL